MSDAVGVALSAIEDSWLEVRHSPYIARDLGLPVDRLPDISEATAIARSARARSVLDKIEAIDMSQLPHELALTVEVARQAMAMQAHAGEWYWLLFDPLEIGFYAIFAPTSYGGGFLLNNLSSMFAGFAFTSTGDLDRYLGLIEDLGRLLRQFDARTRGQAERGIHLPREQLAMSSALMTGLRAAVTATFVPSHARLADPAARALIEQRVASTVLPAYDETIAWLSHPDRATAAGEAVGLGHLPGGPEAYRDLVRLHTTLDLTPDEVHQRGLRRVIEIRSEMQAILDEVGATHPVQDHMAFLALDVAWRADGAEAIGAVFQRYADRLKPHIESVFRLKPVADYGVAPLPEALASSMTFGYYDAPSPAEPKGRYLFNAGNLSKQALANVAPLTYHELVPGHHFHMAFQRENQGLHPLRRNSFVNSFNEGWAEYAAHLAGELGMYEQPEERFGKLVMEAFLTTRLVVDTGMNAFGWTLEQARGFMRENAFVSEAEILTESVRYSCGIPAQALAYKIGDLFLQDLRAGMQKALGDRFDIRDFHDAVLAPGALPLRLVEANVHRATALLSSRPHAAT